MRVESPDLAAAQLPQTVPECHAVIAQLLERVKRLEERISLDSNNSSKPPSSNGPGSMNRVQRRASQRRRGAQPGHKGHSRAMLDESEVDHRRAEDTRGRSGGLDAQRRRAVWMDETHYPSAPTTGRAAPGCCTVAWRSTNHQCRRP